MFKAYVVKAKLKNNPIRLLARRFLSRLTAAKYAEQLQSLGYIVSGPTPVQVFRRDLEFTKEK